MGKRLEAWLRQGPWGLCVAVSVPPGISFRLGRSRRLSGNSSLNAHDSVFVDSKCDLFGRSLIVRTKAPVSAGVNLILPG